ncbi:MULTISPECIES: hypothetical protein [Bacillus cereus group]|uniref:hypothetical protein n=1 Tax=Bacillus cereus group TaxID=86661 RepID=UPI0022E0C69F|nr:MULTISPECIES: hypothetical protein [unclassified Bacillus cereus group]MDA2026711.1 hypothetical protein [Bacillus cereus group sp. Bcc03]MDA2713410.1 hypothetical protein [Bacillus cereus group sp. Bc025]HDR7716933.1 hypothetical protein [Bacillus albus]
MRIATEDHVMFKECISAFRGKGYQYDDLNENVNNLKGYLLLDFELKERWEFDFFAIEPTQRVFFQGSYQAFIAPVIMFNSEGYYNAHSFTIALSAIFSFITGRTIKAPRDSEYLRYSELGRELDSGMIARLGLGFPVQTAGVGSCNPQLSSKIIDEYYVDLKEIINILLELPDKTYRQVMQAIRLIQLSYMTKRDDFGLAYYLLISAIESVAQKAITKKSMKEKDPLEEEWAQLTKKNPQIEELLQAYKKEKNKNNYLKQRFVKFIYTYCPPEHWENMKHQYEDVASYISELRGDNDYDIPKKLWSEKYPSDLNTEQIDKILADLYKHRSKYTHEGMDPPHRLPNSNNKFFDELLFENTNDMDGIPSKLVVPSYRLIGFIAKNSILNYVREKCC